MSKRVDTVSFTGTQKGMSAEQKAWFRTLIADLRPKVFRHGACVGSDTDAVEIVHEMFGKDGKCKIIAHPGVFASRPGDLSCRSERAMLLSHEHRKPETMLARNRTMVQLADAVAACPAFRLRDAIVGQSPGGTWYTANFALAAKKPLHIGYPDGSSE